MATDYERYWHAVGDKSRTNRDPGRRLETILRCPQCDEWYSMAAANSVQSDPNALGHRANCWLLNRWAAGVAGGIFDPTGSTGGGDPGGGGGGEPGGGEYTFDSTTSWTFDSATVPTFDAAGV